MDLSFSDKYAHKCCKTLGIKSKVRQKRYRKPGQRYRIYPNLILAELNITGPMQCIVSDMTAFHFNGQYYELTLYLDLWNNEILAHSLSAKRGDRIPRASPRRSGDRPDGYPGTQSSGSKSPHGPAF